MTTFSAKASLAAIEQDSFEHEQLVLCQDTASGLKAVIAIHSTALGPALGGTRFHAYPSDRAAVTDALNLSRSMSYKNAMAGLGFGGGKAVIIGDPSQTKTRELLLAYGRFVASLGGRYTTGCDVGTCTVDMDVIADTCPWTVHRSPGNGGTGNASALTALGVLQGMRAAAHHRWGAPGLRGRTVGVAGLGKVGHLLVRHLVEEGARVVITDVRPEPVRRLVERFPRITVVDDTDTLVGVEGMDVYAPCAMGGVLDHATARTITARIVCGAANNQLADPGVEEQLAERGILYIPDYIVNAGGVIQAAGEITGAAPDRCATQVERIYDTVSEVLRHAQAARILPGQAADRIAEERLRTAARPRAARTS